MSNNGSTTFSVPNPTSDIRHPTSVDTLVIGGGIAGMQSALDLADQGYHVALVEKEASIGGKMIALSKVFPTLDCCSCITTPKMSAVAHHPNIDLLTYCEVQNISQNKKIDLSARQEFVLNQVDRQANTAGPVSIADRDPGTNVRAGVVDR